MDTTIRTFKCNTCNVVADNFEILNDHYKTEWHRHNLKLKGAHLRAVTKEDFEERREYHREQANNIIKNNSVYCTVCQRTFLKDRSYKNHANSKKHRRNEELAAKRNNVCLFCLQPSCNLEENLKHMSQVHEFFVPDAEYCVDFEGFINHIQEKIHKGEY